MTTPIISDIRWPYSINFTPIPGSSGTTAHRTQTSAEIGGNSTHPQRWYLPRGGYQVLVQNHTSKTVNLRWSKQASPMVLADVLTIDPGKQGGKLVSVTADFGLMLVQSVGQVWAQGDVDAGGYITVVLMPYDEG